MLVSLYLSVFFNPLFDILWCLFFTLQLIGYLDIYKLPIPANVEFFFNKILRLVQFTFFSLDTIALAASNGQVTIQEMLTEWFRNIDPET